MTWLVTKLSPARGSHHFYSCVRIVARFLCDSWASC